MTLKKIFTYFEQLTAISLNPTGVSPEHIVIFKTSSDLFWAINLDEKISLIQHLSDIL